MNLRIKIQSTASAAAGVVLYQPSGGRWKPYSHKSGPLVDVPPAAEVPKRPASVLRNTIADAWANAKPLK